MSQNEPVSEATAPAAGQLCGLVCPRCRLEFGDSDAPSAREPGRLARCPRHGVAFVDAAALMAAPGDEHLGETIAGRFTVVARLGTGSMGAVYRARQEAVGRDVALKIVRPDRAYDPDARARFEREARATSSLVSPHTVTVFDFGEAEDGSWFLAMELLEGETVGARLKRMGRFEWREAVRIAREALRSLSEAHAKGIIHRDLKPDNLFLVKLPPDGSDPASEVCKVLDFGIAKWISDEHAPVDQLETQAGTVFGTPRYMSPEQAQGTPLDARSDLYSLGVLLYQMLIGRAPFVDDDAVVVMARHIKDSPPPFDSIDPSHGVPASVESVVRRALEKTPSDRPANADELIALLDRAVVDRTQVDRALVDRAPVDQARSGAAVPSGVGFEPPEEPLALPKPRHFAWLVVALPLLVLGVLGFAWLSAQKDQRSEEAELPADRTTAQDSPVTAQTTAATLKGTRPAERTNRREAEKNKALGEPGTDEAGPKQKPISPPPPPLLPKRRDERYGRFE